ESMNDPVIGGGTTQFGNTRLDFARAALLQLVNSSGVDQVKIVLFRGNDSSTVWMDKTTALNFINTASNFDNSHLASGTNYDAALFDSGSGTDKGLTQGFATAPSTPGDNRIVYFLSDGAPTEGAHGAGIDPTEEASWISFLQNNGVSNAYAVGFGDLNSTNENQLEPIAWTPGETAATHTTGA